MGAGIAHELNSPIAGTLSIAEAMIRRTEGKDRFLLEKIKDAAVRCKYIILDMLAYARPETAELKPLYLNEIIKSTLSLFISELKKASIEIREEFAPDVPEIVGNKGQLMQAFLNIIKNARDAIQGPGTIAIKTGVSEKGRYAFAEISDTGAGISEEIKDRIFDPFFTTKKDVRTNVGLGLSITRSIMESHGGRIEFSNRTGGGAVFRVYLPLEGGADAGGGNREDKGAEV
jgi:signal transduction histidine kinase